MHFGKHLHALREERRLSLRGFAARVGVAHTQIVRWEKQPYLPKGATLERIANGMNCPVTLLLPSGDRNDTKSKTPISSGTERALEERIEILEAKLKEYWNAMDSQVGILRKAVELIALVNEQNGGKFNGIFLEVSGAIHDHENRRIFDNY